MSNATEFKRGLDPEKNQPTDRRGIRLVAPTKTRGRRQMLNIGVSPDMFSDIGHTGAREMPRSKGPDDNESEKLDETVTAAIAAFAALAVGALLGYIIGRRSR